jgi:hypothetical protein
MEWTGAARDHDTFWISSHPPRALSRPALRAALAERSPTVDERGLIDSVTKRLPLWKDIGPYSSDTGYECRTAESRRTESVLNG